MRIIGQTQDLEPNGTVPRLELYFDRKYSQHLPHGDKAPIAVEAKGRTYVGTVCTTNKNRPYLHHRMTVDGSKASTTDLLLSLNVAEKAQLEFEVVSPTVLRVESVLNPGKWRPGGDPRERKGGAPTRSSPSRASHASDSPHALGFPFDDRAAILGLEQLYWKLTTPAERVAEESIAQLIPEAQRRCHLTKDEFVLMARWKSVRKTPDYLANSEASVEAATRAALAARTEADAIHALTGLQGVALRTATALLHWLRPDEFPILDFRVVRALGESDPSSWEDVGFYSRIAVRVRELARRHSVSLREIDRALWAWQKQNS